MDGRHSRGRQTLRMRDVTKRDVEVVAVVNGDGMEGHCGYEGPELPPPIWNDRSKEDGDDNV